MIEQHNNQVNNNRSNGEARCFLCLKNTLDEYSFQFEDLCHFIIKKKIFCKKESKQKNEKELSQNLYNSLKEESKKLIKPCKCDIYVHIQCLIQYCIMHLNLICEECNCEYCFDFKNLNENSNSLCYYISKILWIICHVILLIGTILFFVLKIIPKKFDSYNYIIAIVLLLFNCLLFYGNYLNYKPNQYLHQNIYPLFIQYNNIKKNDEIYTLYASFLQRTLKSTMFEIVEKRINNKIFLSTTLNSQKEINEYINSNNNNLFDQNSEDIKEKIKEEELENKFHGAQIIKSSLVQIDKINIDEIQNENSNINKIKSLPKSKTKSTHMRYSQNIPKANNTNKVYSKSHFEKINEETKRQNTNIENINSSKGNLIDDILNLDVKKSDSNGNNLNENNNNEKPTIEQQEFEKLTLMKSNSNNNSVQGEK